MLDVRFLGDRRVIDERDERSPSLSSRSLELLAFLVVHAGVPQHRSHLAELFWPESTEAQARTNLRRELHNLRVSLAGDPSLDIQPATLTWRDAPSCRVDVRTFERERLAAERAKASGEPEEWLLHAEAAISEYRGEFMPGLMDQWALESAADFLQRCIDLYDAVVRALRDLGELGRACYAARRRIQLMPFEEVGYRSLMELEIELGDRAAAVSTYHRCFTLLERELGVSPDPATTAIVETLLKQSKQSSGQAMLNGTVHVPLRRAQAAFVGRDRELEALISRWRVADAGESHLALVTGDPGVGKTRLVAELAAFVAAEGAVVASARCFGQPGGVAFAPIAEWLRCPEIRSTTASLEPEWRIEVARLVERESGSPLGSRATSNLTLQPEGNSWARIQFFEGLARATLSTGRPTLLVLDDLQWCDQETVTWLVYLLRFGTDSRLLVAATARSDTLSNNREVAATVRALTSGGSAFRLELAPLEAADTAALASQLMGRALMEPDKELLHAATGGFPLFVVEAAQSQRLSGRSDPIAVADMGGVLHRRLEETSPNAQEVAHLAAAIGRNFTLDLLLEACDLDSDSLVAAVDELWHQRIFMERNAEYDFSHDLLRDAAYSSVSSARQWLLHRRVAQGLELLHGGHIDVVASELAEQYNRAGRPDRALPYFLRAAERAYGLFAFGEALRQYRTCLGLIETLPESRDRDAQELDVLQSMCAPLNALRGYASPELQSTLDRSVTLADRLSRHDVLVLNLVGLFAVRFVQGGTAQSHELACRALALAGDDSDLAGQAHFAFAGSATSLGKFEVAIEHFDIASTLSTGAPALVLGTRPEVHAQAWSAHPTWLLGMEDEALARSVGAVQRARRVDQPYSLVVSLAYAAITDQLRGDVDALQQTVAELRALCRRHEFAYYGEWGLILDGWGTGGARGVSQIRLGISSLRAQGAYARMPYWLSLLGETLIGCGDREEARAVLDAAQVAAEQHDDVWWLPEILRRRASLEQGSRAQALLNDGLALANSQAAAALAARCKADLATLGVRGAPA